MVLGWQALDAKKADKPLEQGRALEQVGARMKRVMGLTAKVSGPQNAGPLDRRVRPEGQKGTPCLEEGRGPRKNAGPRKRRSAARMIAGSACCTSAGRQRGLKTPWTRQSAGIDGCAHEAGDGTNAQVNRQKCAAFLSVLNRQLGILKEITSILQYRARH